MSINLTDLVRIPGGTTFRLQARKLLLTYPGWIEKEQLDRHIREITGCEDIQVKIAHETGDTGHKHTHAAVDLGKTFNSRSARVFDIDGVHPNIQIPKSNVHWERIVKYLDKDDQEVYGEIKVTATKGPSEENLSMMEECIQWVLTCTDRSQVLLPPSGEMRYFMMSRSNYFMTLYTWSGQKKSATANFSTFSREKISPQLLASKSWLITGPPATGKTQWALSHFEKAVLVRHLDDLHNITTDTDGVVFDDMSFKHMPPQAIIHLLDMDYDSPVHLRYNNGRIPKGLPRIFTSNDSDIFVPTAGCSDDVLGAISRRYELILITEKLY
jgi:hypothetical protein